MTLCCPFKGSGFCGTLIKISLIAPVIIISSFCLSQDVGEAAIRLSVRWRFEPQEPLLHRVQLSERRTTVSDTVTAESGNLTSQDIKKKNLCWLVDRQFWASQHSKYVTLIQVISVGLAAKLALHLKNHTYIACYQLYWRLRGHKNI